jgi:hypothetical protein
MRFPSSRAQPRDRTRLRVRCILKAPTQRKSPNGTCFLGRTCPPARRNRRAIPCIYRSGAQDRSKRGRSWIFGPSEAVVELASPRLDRSRSQVRTVAGTGTKPGRIAQVGRRAWRGRWAMRTFMWEWMFRKKGGFGAATQWCMLGRGQRRTSGEPLGQAPQAPALYAGGGGSHRRL